MSEEQYERPDDPRPEGDYEQADFYEPFDADYFDLKLKYTIEVPASYGLWAKTRGEALEHAKQLLLQAIPYPVEIIDEKVEEVTNLSKMSPRERLFFESGGGGDF
jgi:hypothetical protein